MCFQLALGLGSIANAQIFPVDANAVLIPPNSIQLADYTLEKSQDLVINLTLNDPVEAFLDVRLRVTISNNGVDILETNPGFMPSVPIRLNQFTPVTLNGFDMAEYLSFNSLVPLNGYNHTGLLPEGLNAICVEVLDFNRQDVIISHKACANGFFQLNDPPFAQVPYCGETVEHIGPQNILFTWLPMHLGSPNNVANVEYEFTLVKVEDGYNVYEAMEAAAPVIQTTVATQSFVLQDPLLEDGFQYAWQVRVFDPFGEDVSGLFRNQGRSQVCYFTYQEYQFPDASELYADEAGECSSSCQADLPTNSELISELGRDDIVEIGKFKMTVTEVTAQSGNFFSGKGSVFIPFLLSNLRVTFTDLTINTDGVAFSGEIEADIDTDLLPGSLSSDEGEITASAPGIDQLNDYVNTESRKVSEMDQSSTLGLPFALDKNVGGIDYNVIITGITFEMDIAYLNAALSIEDPESGNSIAFGGKGICFQPFGVGGAGSAELYLLEDFSLGDYSELDITFKAPGDDNPGSYISFDCQGFVELNIEGEYEFPEDILASPDGPGPVTATFNINTTEWGQFIASIDMGDFEIQGVNGYTFSLNEAYIDYSDNANPADLEFPSDYENDGDDWKGFYLASVSVTLPGDLTRSTGELSFGAENIIIDQSGVSGTAFGAGLLDLQTGRLSDWAFSLDTVSLTLVSNSLSEGKLLGEIHVPITAKDNPLAYEGVMTPTDEGIDLQFGIQPTENIEVSMWAASLTLESSSVIAVSKTSEGFKPYTELHGNIGLTLEIQDGNEFSFEAMAFEGLKVNHPDEDSRLVVDAFSLFGGGDGFEEEEETAGEEAGEEEQETLSGFPVSFSNVDFVSGPGDEAGIAFDLNLNLTGDALGVSGTAGLTVTGDYDASGAPFNAWEFKAVELSTIEVAADMASGSIEGSLQIYKGDETYGSGFKGLLKAQFTGLGEVDALAQFGKVSGYRYFFVDAMILSSTPYIDVMGVGLYGLGGGMYHHMSREDRNPAMDLEAGTLFAEPAELGASLSGIIYTPDKSTLLGLKAGLTLGIAPGTSFSTDVNFEASFGLNNGAPSIRNIAFGGSAYLMSPGTILDREDSKVVGQFDANLDLSDPKDPVFTGVAEVELELAIISGAGQAAMQLSRGESYLWLGTPTNMISVNIADLATIGMYADLGDIVPPMPSIRDLVPDFSGAMIDQRPLALNGTKIIFGARFDMPEKRYTLGPFYASAYFGMGFDAYLRQVSASNCGLANGNIGFDNWYLSGQAYAYGGGNIGIRVRTFFYRGNVNLLDLSASIVMQAELPNPSWLRGDVNVRYRILGGAIKGRVNFKFEVGERCDFSENAMAGVEVIADISPENNEMNVSCLASPTIATNFPLNRDFKVEQLDGEGDLETYYYQPYVSSFTMNQGASYNRKIAPDGNTASLALKDMLKPYTDYSVTVKVKWKKRKKGRSSWEILNGEESKTIWFRTGQLPDFIPDDAVAISFPFKDGRNIYDRSSTSDFIVYMKMAGWGYLFEDDADFEYKMKIEDLTGGGSRTAPVQYSEQQHASIKLAFIQGGNSSWNSWINGRDGNIFKISIVGEYKKAGKVSLATNTNQQKEGVQVRQRRLSGTNEADIEDKQIYSWYFRKSSYDSPADKIGDFYFSREKSYTERYRGYNTKRYEVHGGLRSSERFDAIDFNGYNFSINGYDLRWPSVFYLHRIDHDYSADSKVKSIMTRYYQLRNTASSLSGRRRDYKRNRSRNRSRWRGHRDNALRWNKWDVWGSSKGYNWMSRSFCQSWLTDSEKTSGVAGNGYTQEGSTSVRFYTLAERWVADVHRNLQNTANNNTKKGYRFNNGKYVYKNWNADGALKNSRWGIGWRNPESNVSGIYWLKLNQ